MKCPNCQTDLVMSERSGIEIDYCPQCRGVWLDRGELDKIIERNAQSNINTEFNQPPARNSDLRDNRKYDDDDDYKRKNKRKGLFDDLFDF